MRRAILLATALATALALAAPAAGTPQADGALQVAGDRQPYIVIMDDDPVVAYEGDVPGLPATKPGKGNKVNPKSPAVKKYQEHLEEEREDVQDGAGVDESQVVATFDFALTGFSALLTPFEAEKLRSQKGVIAVVRDELKQLHTDTSGDFLGLTEPGGAYDSGITGEGVVVGVIDTGIWPEHPSFADDGSYPAPANPIEDVDTDPDPDEEEILLGCHFGNTAHNPTDEPFECNNKLIGARDMRALYNELIGPELYDSARDFDGHGSHTAGTAAGNAGVEASIFGIPRGTISGIAPRAHVVAYKGCGDLGCFVGDLAAAIDQAVADGVDVINYSIGSITPGLTGADDIAFLFAADAGVHVATSAGNSGPGDSTVGSPASVPWLTSVGASHHDRMFQGSVVLENGSDEDEDEDEDEEEDEDDEEDEEDEEKGEKEKRGKEKEDEDEDEEEEDEEDEDEEDEEEREEYFGASVTGGVGPAPIIDAALLKNELCDPAVKFRPPPKGKIVLCKGAVQRAAKSRAVLEQGGVGMVLYNDADHQTLPSDNHYVPTVHVSHDDGIAIKEFMDSIKPGRGRGKAIGITADATINGGVAVPREIAPFMAYFSSRGPVGSPASADIIKPDVTAPGVQILAANSPAPGFDAPGELFMAIQGTSMSSPHVAGLLALLEDARPDWSPAAAKSALMTTAYQDVFKENQTTPADPFDVGAGHVDGTGGLNTPNSLFNPGIVYDAGFFEYLGFLCDEAPEVFANPAGTCGFLGSIGVPLESENLNYPSIGVSEVPGTKTITRMVTNVSGSYLTLTASVEAPPGYEVVVTPSTLTIPDGDSASFDVRFDNVSAPLDQWRFGSLTWEGDGYAARSPIAVAAAQLEAPAEVTGTGVEGQASFDVAFGYTGEYDAAAHGLAPNMEIVGTVTQDADQSFDPSDEGNGATAHDITLSGSAFFRITLATDDLDPPNANIDLDLFLFRDGQLVGVSGAPSTEELIELTAPADGNYTLFVHGWQTTGLEVGYSVNTWDIPSEADTGSLRVDDEPENATARTTATITVGWSGLDPAVGDYLGAVSHHDADGQIGLTLVEVSTE